MLPSQGDQRGGNTSSATVSPGGDEPDNGDTVDEPWHQQLIGKYPEPKESECWGKVLRYWCLKGSTSDEDWEKVQCVKAEDGTDGNVPTGDRFIGHFCKACRQSLVLNHSDRLYAVPPEQVENFIIRGGNGLFKTRYDCKYVMLATGSQNPAILVLHPKSTNRPAGLGPPPSDWFNGHELHLTEAGGDRSRGTDRFKPKLCEGWSQDASGTTGAKRKRKAAASDSTSGAGSSSFSADDSMVAYAQISSIQYPPNHHTGKYLLSLMDHQIASLKAALTDCQSQEEKAEMQARIDKWSFHRAALEEPFSGSWARSLDELPAAPQAAMDAALEFLEAQAFDDDDDELADQCEELRAMATREIVRLVPSCNALPVISEAAGPAESDMLRSFDHGGDGIHEWLSFLADAATGRAKPLGFRASEFQDAIGKHPELRGCVQAEFWFDYRSAPPKPGHRYVIVHLHFAGSWTDYVAECHRHKPYWENDAMAVVTGLNVRHSTTTGTNQWAVERVLSRHTGQPVYKETYAWHRLSYPSAWSWQSEGLAVENGETVPTEERALLLTVLDKLKDLRETLTGEQTRGLDPSLMQDSTSESAAVDPLLISKADVSEADVETQLVVRVAEVAEAVRAALPSSGAMPLVHR